MLKTTILIISYSYQHPGIWEHLNWVILAHEIAVKLLTGVTVIWKLDWSQKSHFKVCSCGCWIFSGQESLVVCCCYFLLLLFCGQESLLFCCCYCCYFSLMIFSLGLLTTWQLASLWMNNKKERERKKKAREGWNRDQPIWKAHCLL